jgi:hypothetical protein
MALTSDQLVEVINNDNGSVAYYSEYSRIWRRWDKPDSVKKVPLEELRELINTAGGYELLEGYLLIKDMEVREELGLPVDKTYILGEKEIKALLKKSVSVLTDTLENTTDTIREKIAHIAIDTKLADLDKLEVIKEHSGLDVLYMIQENKEAEKEKAAKVKLKSKAK